MRQRRRAIGRGHRQRRVALDIGEAALRDALLHQVERADDAGQQIVEIVRDAAGQLADRFHLLRLAQLLLGAAQRFGGVALGRHVAAERIDQPVLGGRGPGEPAVRSVLVAIAVLEAHGRPALHQLLAMRERRLRRRPGCHSVGDRHARAARPRSSRASRSRPD